MRPAFAYFLLVAGLWSAVAARARGEELATMPREMQAFLKQHCFACHGSEKQEGQLRYDQLAGYEVKQQHLWTKIYEQLSAGEMPPKEQPQPTAAERKSVLAWIEQQSARAPRGTGLRRLNRRELSASLRDLTGLAVNYADALPGDGTVEGFDTGAEALQDAADSVAQAMLVARRAVEGICFLERPASKSYVLDFRELKDTRAVNDAAKALGMSVKVKGPIRLGKGFFLEPQWVGDRNNSNFTVPMPLDGRGVLRVKLLVAAVKPMAGLPDPHLWIEVGARDIDYRVITAPLDAPQALVYEVQLDDLATEKDGMMLSLAGKIEIPYAVPGYENEDRSKPEEKIPGGTGLWRPLVDRKAKPNPEDQPFPFVVVQRIEIEQDYVALWPPAAWGVDLGPIKDDAATARKLLALWQERAWRRPVAAAEQQRFLALYQALRVQNLSFDDALRASFQAVLMSGPFRYLASPADADPIQAQFAIASRLSFMLSGEPPDAELRRLATEQKLRDPAVLDAQVDRLLADPRSEAFFRPFVTQWLVLDQPITLAMDHIQKQDFRFGRYLKESMREETIAYVTQMFAENRPAKELIDSDWTMMNESLAIHYGYQDVRGGKLRRVALRKDDPRRGGLLGQAGIQSMLCWMGENWLIYRGSWALRHILNDPPPPPPLEVPELIPSDGANKGKTFRELLKQHQEDQNCTVCHKKIDPLGFAFQNFDLSGRWRNVEHESYKRAELDGKIEWHGVGATRPVDAAGKLPRGEEFRSFAECKELIAKHYLPDVVGGLLQNLTIYSLGRKPGVQDVTEIRQIVADHTARGYPLRDILKAAICRQAFLGQ